VCRAGRARRVTRDHGDAGKRQIELLGRDLRERGENALPQLDLSRENRRRSVGTDAQPGIEHAVLVEAAGSFTGAASANGGPSEKLSTSAPAALPNWRRESSLMSSPHRGRRAARRG